MMYLFPLVMQLSIQAICFGAIFLVSMDGEENLIYISSSSQNDVLLTGLDSFCSLFSFDDLRCKFF